MGKVMLPSVAGSREACRFAARESEVGKCMATKLRPGVAAFESGESLSGGGAMASADRESRMTRPPTPDPRPPA